MKQHNSHSTRNLGVVVIIASIALIFGDAHSQDRALDILERDQSDNLTLSQTDEDNPPRRNTFGDDSPVILGILENLPDTASERMAVIQTTLNLGRADLAQRFIDELIAQNLSDPELYQLQQEFGSAIYLELFRSKELTVEANQFARQVLEASYSESRSPARISQLIGDLTNDATNIRRRARNDLKTLGADAVPALLLVLTDDSRSSEHSAVANALLSLDRAAIDPLLGSLRAPHPRVRQAAIEILNRHRVQDAIPGLIYPCVAADVSNLEREVAVEAINNLLGASPNLAEAKLSLRNRIRAFRDGMIPGTIDLDQMVTLWRWADESSGPIAQRMSPKLASLTVAAELANDLYRLDPNDPDVQETFLSTSIEVEKRRLGLDVPLASGHSFDVAQVFGIGMVERVLESALDQNDSVSAAGAAELLGVIATSDILATEDGTPSILCEALRFGDRRTRFAAAMAILSLDPQSAYAGSSQFVDTLVYFLRSAGERRVLIGHTRLDQAQTMAASLQQMGYQTEVALWGNDVFRMAANQPDYEIILISDSIDNPNASELIQQIRRDPRTSKLPIGLLARHEQLTRARRVASEDPLTMSMPWPHEGNLVQFTARQIESMMGGELVDADTRLHQAERALVGLLSIVEREDELRFYDFRRHENQIILSLYTPNLSPGVSRLLGLSGSPMAQRELVNYANQSLMSIESRKIAAESFQIAVDRRGILLTSREVLRQYDRYNQSVDEDVETQLLLGSILDTIEASQHRR